MTGTVAPVPVWTLLDSDGNPLVSGKLYTYAAGTSTPIATYTSSTLATPNANPVIADAAGRVEIWLSPGTAYKFQCDNSADVTQWTVDNVEGVPLTNLALDITGTAGESLSAGDAVYLSDGSGGATAGRWYKTDSDNTYSSSAAPMAGMVQDAIASAATGSIRLQGRITGLSGLIAGTIYYAGATAGSLTSTAPANSLFMGAADSSTTFVLQPSAAATSSLDSRVTVLEGLTVDAGAANAGIVSTGTQTFGGTKSLTSPVWLGLPTGIGAFVTSYASANTTVNNSTTLVNVTGLSFAVAASASYIFYFIIHGTSNIAADWKMTLTGPAAPTAIRFGTDKTLASSVGSSAAFGTALVLESAGNDECHIVSGQLRNGANSGTVQFQFAQSTADVSNSIVYAESCVQAWRIA